MNGYNRGEKMSIKLKKEEHKGTGLAEEFLKGMKEELDKEKNRGDKMRDKSVNKCKTIVLFILLVVSIIIYGYKDFSSNTLVSNVIEISSFILCFSVTITLAIRKMLRFV